MIKIFIIILVFIIGIILQYFISNNLKNKKISHLLNDEIEFNQINELKIRNILENTIKERIKLLEKMDYNDWLKYNQKNNIVKIDKYNYPIIIYQLVIKDDDFYKSTFINRVHHIEKYINFSWSDVTKDVKNLLVFEKYYVDYNLLPDSYYSTKEENTVEIFNYFWYDHDKKIPIKKKTYTKYWEKDNMSGTLSIGLPFNYPVNKYTNYVFIQKYIIIIINIFIIIVSLLYYYLYNNFFKSIIFIFIINIFIIIYFNNHGEIASPQVELDKINNINSGVLGISFLTAVNVYILTTLRKYENNIFSESSILFMFSIIFILIATYKKTNYSDVKDLIKIRITKQLSFNLAVFLNILIIVNYLIFISKKIINK